MMPTAISCCETVGKLIFGLIFARMAMGYGEKQYLAGGPVFVVVTNHDEALVHLSLHCSSNNQWRYSKVQYLHFYMLQLGTGLR